jgi:hypothetical protein
MSNNTATKSNSDNSTKTVIEVFADIVDKYVKADKGDKARIRANVSKKALSALSDGNFALATKYNETLKLLVPVKSDKTPDFGQIAANANFVLKGMIAAFDSFVTEHGITDISDITDETLKSTLSNKSDKMVKSLLSVKSDRRDIQGVFERAFEGAEVGTTMLVSEIANAGRLPDYQPGSGAVAARLRGEAPATLTADCSLVGFEPVWLDKSGNVSTELERPSLAHNVAARKTA